MITQFPWSLKDLNASGQGHIVHDDFLRSAFRQIRTIPDPELPDSNHVLYFVLVEFNLENISELKRVMKLEMEGRLDNETLGQFVEAWFRKPLC